MERERRAARAAESFRALAILRFLSLGVLVEARGPRQAREDMVALLLIDV